MIQSAFMNEKAVYEVDACSIRCRALPILEPSPESCHFMHNPHSVVDVGFMSDGSVVSVDTSGALHMWKLL